MDTPSPAQTLRWQNDPATRLCTDADVRTTWDRLNGLRRDLPFLGASQVGVALECFGSGQERLLQAQRPDGSTVAMFVLVPDGRLKWRSFQPSQLPLGPWVSDGSESLATLTRDLLKPLFPCLALTISQADPWIEPRPADQPAMQTADYITTGWIELEGDFEPYWESRSKDLRLNLRRRRKRLSEDGKTARMDVRSDAAAMPDAVRRYGALESQGWKGAQGTAVSAENAQGRYYVKSLQDAAARGEARVYEYAFDNECVAVDLCQLRGDVLVVLKITYDEALKNYSPAFMLREDQMRHLFEEGRIRRVEFYGRFMDWHARWTDQTRVLYHLTRYRWAWVVQVWNWLKRSRPQAPADNSPE